MATPERNPGQEETQQSKILSTKLNEYMSGASFGSPRFIALYDIADTWSVLAEIESKIEDLAMPREGLTRAKTESELRIAEHEAAILSQRTKTREAEMKGYALARYVLYGTTGDLLEAYQEEVKKYNPALSDKDVREKSSDLRDEKVWSILNSIIRS